MSEEYVIFGYQYADGKLQLVESEVLGGVINPLSALPANWGITATWVDRTLILDVSARITDGGAGIYERARADMIANLVAVALTAPCNHEWTESDDPGWDECTRCGEIRQYEP
jgi:hypothetical protein